MVFDPKKSGERLAHLAVLDNTFGFETPLKYEKEALEILQGYAKADPISQTTLEDVFCREVTYSDWKRRLGFTGARQFRFFEEHGLPDCDNPTDRVGLIPKALDYRFEKFGFRPPKLDRMRSLYFRGE